MAYAHLMATLERLVADATMRAGFAAMAGEEGVGFPDFFELKAQLDRWLVSEMQPVDRTPGSAEQRAERRSLGLGVR